MTEPISFIKVFVCDYIEDIEDMVNEYAKEHKCRPTSASVTNLNGCLAVTVAFRKRL